KNERAPCGSVARITGRLPFVLSTPWAPAVGLTRLPSPLGRLEAALLLRVHRLVRLSDQRLEVAGADAFPARASDADREPVGPLAPRVVPREHAVEAGDRDLHRARGGLGEEGAELVAAHPGEDVGLAEGLDQDLRQLDQRLVPRGV